MTNNRSIIQQSRVTGFLFTVCLLFGSMVTCYAQTEVPRMALVIGNSQYIGLSTLKNPVNDASDVGSALERLGFTVEVLTNANLDSMEASVIRLKNNLSAHSDAIGLFYYAGHGVQSGGSNYLIPSDARITDEVFLKTKALSSQSVMDLMQSAGNHLNLVFLDACRDNPFAWSRGGGRGLTVVSNQPPGSIVVFATSAGSVAQDGSGRNGLFTAELLKNIETPGIDLNTMLDRTALGVLATSGNKQSPGIYKQYFDVAYLGGKPPAGFDLQRAPGPITQPAENRSTMGNETIALRQKIGDSTQDPVPEDMVWVEGGSYVRPDGKEITVTGLYVSRTEVTQSDFKSITGNNPSSFADTSSAAVRPVESISWYEAIEYCNIRSLKEGLQAAYTINRRNPDANNISDIDGKKWQISVDWDASGYRLPTEAEWEYAARGGTFSNDYLYAGSSRPTDVAWFNKNSGEGLMALGPKKTKPVATKKQNELGIYDMSGNVSEWCWDWFSASREGQELTNPAGPVSGDKRVIKGGSEDKGMESLPIHSREGFTADTRNYDIGFRVVRSNTK